MHLLGLIEELPEGWTVQQVDEACASARYDVAEGSIHLMLHELARGIFLSRIDLQCPTLPAPNPIGRQLATLNWCASGRCEVDFGERGSMVVGSQTLCLSSTYAQTFSYPTGSYQGFELFVYFSQLDEGTWTVLSPFGLGESVLRPLLQPHGLGMNLVPSGPLAASIHAIEEELAQEHARRPWLLLETCRMLMLLAETDLAGSASPGSYLQRSQRDIAQAVRQQIMDQDSPTANLQPLAQRLGVSEASLRSYFVRVYGETPASYARARMLAKAARLLGETDWPVADVAQACGYANPSKFSAAFKRAYESNPLEYRRRSRL